MMEDTINKAESLLHKIETATQKIGLFLNASKTFVAMNFSPSVESHIHALNSDEIEKVDDFGRLHQLFSRNQHPNRKIMGRSQLSRKNLELSHYYKKLGFLNLLLSPYCYMGVNPG